jgi:hypothetical protein
MRPVGSITQLTPVFAHRTIGSPVSMQRKTALAVCTQAPGESRNHPSLVRFTKSLAPRPARCRASAGRVSSKQIRIPMSTGPDAAGASITESSPSPGL